MNLSYEEMLGNFFARTRRPASLFSEKLMRDIKMTMFSGSLCAYFLVCRSLMFLISSCTDSFFSTSERRKGIVINYECNLSEKKKNYVRGELHDRDNQFIVYIFPERRDI